MTDQLRNAVVLALSESDRRALSILAASIFQWGYTVEAQDRFQDSVSPQGERALLEAAAGDIAQTAIDALPLKLKAGALLKLGTSAFPLTEKQRENRAKLLSEIVRFQSELLSYERKA